MRSATKFLLIFICLLLGLSMIAAGALASDGNALEDMRMVAENEYLRLFIDASTTEVAVQRKDSGTVWRTIG